MTCADDTHWEEGPDGRPAIAHWYAESAAPSRYEVCIRERDEATGESSDRGKYRGTVRAFRLAGIDPKTRRLLVACQVAGEFLPPVASALAPKDSPGSEPTRGWKSFTFDVRAGVNIEPGRDGTPRFRVEVEE